MQSIISGLAVFFFLLSGFITFKALQIPSKNLWSQGKTQGDRFDNAQTTKRALSDALKPFQTREEAKASNKNGKPQTDIRGKESSKKEKVLAVFGDGMFRPGQFDINSNQQPALVKLVPLIRASSDYRLLIEGYTDNIRPSAGKRYIDNMELSFLRAKAVALLFVKNGIPIDRISVIGYGDTRPLASNDTPAGRAKNRRVEVKLVPER